MKNYWLLIPVLLEMPLILLAHKIGPTSEAGPGLDFFGWLFAMLYDVFIIIFLLKRWKKDLTTALYIAAMIVSGIWFYLWFING
jgi:hypothetical protein